MLSMEKQTNNFSKGWNLFIRVLKDNNAYGTYIKSVMRHGNLDRMHYLTKANLPPAEIMDKSFIWEYTREGHYFWRSMYTKMTPLNA